jgi:hypothetical protein
VGAQAQTHPDRPIHLIIEIANWTKFIDAKGHQGGVTSTSPEGGG